MTEIKYETDGGFCLTPCPLLDNGFCARLHIPYEGREPRGVATVRTFSQET